MRGLLEAGTPAPDFEGPTQDGTPFRLQDQRGRWVVLYFYPKDRTRGCTAEACAFRDVQPDLRAAGAVVVGVSRDTVESHRDFAQRHRLPFPLVADAGGRIARLYQAHAWYGLARRVTYLINPQGRIAASYARVRPRRHATSILSDYERLKRSATGDKAR